jgi:hypothetical protein
VFGVRRRVQPGGVVAGTPPRTTIELYLTLSSVYLNTTII